MKPIQTVSLIAAVAFTLTACNSTQKAMEEKDTAKEAEMMAQGFTKGTIEHSTKEGDCAYTISVDLDGNSLYYDPVNLEEDFQKDKAAVWFKFRGLRMMNRCDKATPISLSEIQMAN